MFKYEKFCYRAESDSLRSFPPLKIKTYALSELISDIASFWTNYRNMGDHVKVKHNDIWYDLKFMVEWGFPTVSVPYKTLVKYLERSKKYIVFEDVLYETVKTKYGFMTSEGVITGSDLIADVAFTHKCFFSGKWRPCNLRGDDVVIVSLYKKSPDGEVIYRTLPKENLEILKL